MFFFRRKIQWDDLNSYLSEQYRLELDSVHGPSHWQRVERVGMVLAEENGADKEVVRLFSVLHDACRENEFFDELHGERGAELAKLLQNKYYKLSKGQLEKLQYACANHAHGMISDDVTIGTCWDADRLDLGRVGEIPREEYLSTEAGKLYLRKGYSQKTTCSLGSSSCSANH